MRRLTCVVLIGLLLPELASAQSIVHLKNLAPYGAQPTWQFTSTRTLAQSFGYNRELWTPTRSPPVGVTVQ